MFDNELAFAGVDTFDNSFTGGLLGCFCYNESRRYIQRSGIGHAVADNNSRGEDRYEFQTGENGSSALSSSTMFISASSITRATAEATHMAWYSFRSENSLLPPSCVPATRCSVS